MLLTDIPTYMSVYTVLYSIAHLVIIVNKSYFNQINIYITYLLQLFLEVFELTQLTGQTGGQTCDKYMEKDVMGKGVLYLQVITILQLTGTRGIKPENKNL